MGLEAEAGAGVRCQISPPWIADFFLLLGNLEKRLKTRMPRLLRRKQKFWVQGLHVLPTVYSKTSKYGKVN